MMFSFEINQFSILFQSVVIGPGRKIPFSNREIIAVILFILFSLLWTVTLMSLCSLYKSYKRSHSLKRTTKKGNSLEKQMSLI